MWLWSFLYLFPSILNFWNKESHKTGYVSFNLWNLPVNKISLFSSNSSLKASNNWNWFLRLVYSASQHMIVRKNHISSCNIFHWYNILHLRFSRLSIVLDYGRENEGIKNDSWDNGISLWHSKCDCCCLLNTSSEEGKTQENKTFTVFALIAIRRHLAYQTHWNNQNIPQSIRLHQLAQTHNWMRVILQIFWLIGGVGERVQILVWFFIFCCL